ncbi:MAG: hypothetical protein ABS46_08030, partial [Cytophagaceae bacterium SCN 52-12]
LVRHLKVFGGDGEFAAWPANHGIWIWENEILVGFVRAKHKEGAGHTYNRDTARDYYGRSLNGGDTWTLENAYEHGQTAERYNNRLGDKATEPTSLQTAIDFSNPDLALTFQRVTNDRGPSHFYYSYDRGKQWNGPYRFPQYGPGTTNRTSYIVNGKHDLLSFVSIGHGSVGLVRTTDGGISWEYMTTIGPDKSDPGTTGFLTMPSSVRLDASTLLTIIRQREDTGEDLLVAYRSADDGKTWQKLADPVSDTGRNGSPPALLKLKDGRLCLAYAVRGKENQHSRMALKISTDNGQSWSKEMVFREKDGANWDIGYPRMIQRPDGKLVVVYYWNHAITNTASPYRYIAASIIDPEFVK